MDIHVSYLWHCIYLIAIYMYVPRVYMFVTSLSVMRLSLSVPIFRGGLVSNNVKIHIYVSRFENRVRSEE